MHTLGPFKADLGGSCNLAHIRDLKESSLINSGLFKSAAMKYNKWLKRGKYPRKQPCCTPSGTVSTVTTKQLSSRDPG